MRYLLVFPNGYTVDITDRPLSGPPGSVYDTSWVEDKQLALMEWLVYGKIEHVVDNQPTLSVFLEEATQSRDFQRRFDERFRRTPKE